jgi:hypothetical protein
LLWIFSFSCNNIKKSFCENFLITLWNFQMFEMARLGGTPLKRIILQTREGRNVENTQSCEPDATIRNSYDQLRGKHFAWVNRKSAYGVYNCFGLVWASRRTSIYDENDISKILKDDGYRQLVNEGQLQPGDVVLYRLNGNTLHAAIVLELKPLHPGTSKIPWVLSKWNDVSGEDIHALRDIPECFRDCQIELLTDRPL